VLPFVVQFVLFCNNSVVDFVLSHLTSHVIGLSFTSLWGCGIGPVGGKAFGQFLKKNKTVTTISYEIHVNGDLFPSKFYCICRFIKSHLISPSYKNILYMLLLGLMIVCSLGNNHLGDEGVVEFANALDENSSLVTLLYVCVHVCVGVCVCVRVCMHVVVVGCMPFIC